MVDLKITITAIVKDVDEDDVPRVRAEGWEDLLTELRIKGIPINKRVDVLKDKT